MLKKTIKYVDYDNNEREEDFYFHLNRAEAIEFEMSMNGGLSNYIKKLITTQDGAEIMKIMKDIILRSYGEKSNDGRRFIKSEELAKAFTETEAYAVLFTELVTNPKSAADFITGIIPKDVADEVKKRTEFTNTSVVTDAMSKANVESLK